MISASGGLFRVRCDETGCLNEARKGGATSEQARTIARSEGWASYLKGRIRRDSCPACALDWARRKSGQRGLFG